MGSRTDVIFVKRFAEENVGVKHGEVFQIKLGELNKIKKAIATRWPFVEDKGFELMTLTPYGVML